MSNHRLTPKYRLHRPLVLGGITAVTALAVLGVAAPASAETDVAEPSTFTSAFTVMATPDQVLNADAAPTPGEAGATGSFTFRVNSELDVICYDIDLTGVTGEYASPAKTATHIHQAAVGKAGPPRIAFPNPVAQSDGTRTGSGCLKGPFTTGIVANGADTGTGFTVAQLETDAAAFAADSHTATFTAGVVRGQLTQVPVGGVQTGGGATAASVSGTDAGLIGSAGVAVAGAGVAALVAAGGYLVVRRRRAQV